MPTRPSRKPTFVNILLLPALVALLLSACVFETERERGTRSPSTDKGSIELNLKVGEVGLLRKIAAAADIELVALYITLTADQETPRHDTISLSGGGSTTVNRTYSSLAANKTWQVQAYTLDRRGRTIHTANSLFTVQAGRTANVNLDMPAYYSMLRASFYPIDDSVTRCQVQVDGGTVADSGFAKQTRVGDTLRLAYDYLYVGSHRIALNVYGDWNGSNILLYSGDTAVNIQAGAIQRYDINLVWRGPGVFRGSAQMTVVLGSVGRTDLNGRLLTSKNQDPVFTTLDTDMLGVGAPGLAYADTVHALDPDGDSVSYSLLSGPAGLTLTDSMVAWIPDSTAGNAVVSILVRDDKGGRDTLTWNIILYPSALGGFITSDIVLSRANSPYLVTGNILVREGVTMTIEPGVRVVLGEGRGIQINGTLVARGTEADSIVFTAARAGSKWARILFADSSRDAVYDGSGNYLGGSILEYCRIEYGGKGVSGMVQMENASPYIHRDLIFAGDARGIAALGLPIIDGCRIRNNAGGGISYTQNSSTRGVIRNNLVDSNATLGSPSGAGLFLQGRVAVLDNVITNNGNIDSYGYPGGGGIAVACCSIQSGSLISGNRIEGNKSAYSGGLSIYYRDSVLNNIIRGNSSRYYGVVRDYSGGNFYRGNRIEANTSINDYPIVQLSGSVFLENTLIGNFGVSNSLMTDGASRINNNNFLDPGISHELANANPSTATNLDAANNWWGSGDEAEVQGRIYDWFDDASRGIVNYSPFLSAPATGAPTP